MINPVKGSGGPPSPPPPNVAEDPPPPPPYSENDPSPNLALTTFGGGRVTVAVQAVDPGPEGPCDSFFQELRTVGGELSSGVRENWNYWRGRDPGDYGVLEVTGLALAGAALVWYMGGSPLMALGMPSSSVGGEPGVGGFLPASQVPVTAAGLGQGLNPYDGMTTEELEARIARVTQAPTYPTEEPPEWVKEFEEAHEEDILQLSQAELKELRGQEMARSDRKEAFRKGLGDGSYCLGQLKRANAMEQKYPGWSSGFKKLMDEMIKEEEGEIREAMASTSAPTTSGIGLSHSEQNALYSLNKPLKGESEEMQLKRIRGVDKEVREDSNLSSEFRRIVHEMANPEQPTAGPSGMQPSTVTQSSTSTGAPRQEETGATGTEPHQTTTPVPPGRKHTSKTNNPSRNDGS